MTIDEAIADKDRPLSVSPYEWVQYRKAEEKDDETLFDKEAERIVEDETGERPEEMTPQDRLEIGVEQMVVGCKMAMRALQEMRRIDLPASERAKYDKAGNFIFNGVAPYLADALKACMEGADGWKA